eukprot:1156560-Pelagomonas_calceolata.AAC.6
MFIHVGAGQICVRLFLRSSRASDLRATVSLPTHFFFSHETFFLSASAPAIRRSRQKETQDWSGQSCAPTMRPALPSTSSTTGSASSTQDKYKQHMKLSGSNTYHPPAVSRTLPPGHLTACSTHIGRGGCERESYRPMCAIHQKYIRVCSSHTWTHTFRTERATTEVTRAASEQIQMCVRPSREHPSTNLHEQLPTQAHLRACELGYSP